MKIFSLLLFLMIPSMLSSQRVQLSGIPGQNSDMDITDMLDQIMAPYHNELTNLNNTRTDQQIKTELWQEFRSNVQNFEQVNRYITGYESSFRSLTNIISDPSALSIQTSRISKRGEYKLSIDTLATAHSFSSAPINISNTIRSGIFSVIIDTNTNTVTFEEGNIESLYDTLSKNPLTNHINFRMFNASSTEKLLSFISKKEGSQYKISFSGDTTPLLDVKILSKGEQQQTNILWNQQTNKIITNTQTTIDFSYPIVMPTSLNFSTTLSDVPLSPQTNTPVIPLASIPTSEINEINQFNITLPIGSPILDDITPETNTTETPKAPIQQITLNFDDNTTKSIPIDKQLFAIDLSQYQGKTLTGVSFLAEQKILDISSLQLTASPNGESSIYNETVKAQDASFILDGVAFNRPSNTINDIIPGVTLDLQQEQKKNITIKIQPNIELVQETIVQWVMAYNTIMEEIFKFTTIPISQIGRLKPLHKRLEDGDDLKEGTFYGNSSLNGFKDRLRRMVGSLYPSQESSINLLDQIGIYIRRRTELNSDPDALRKGTLTLDMGDLEKALSEDFEGVRNLFSMDTDNNSSGDFGVAISSLEALQAMIGGNGYLTRLEQNNSREVKEMNDRIAKKEDELEKTTIKERRALLQMNQAITQSKALSESLQQRF